MVLSHRAYLSIMANSQTGGVQKTVSGGKKTPGRPKAPGDVSGQVPEASDGVF